MIQAQVMQRATDTAYTASALTTGAGLWAWLGENASSIGALGVLAGIIIGCITCGVNWYYRHKESNKN